MAFVSSLHPPLRAYYILNCDAIFAGPAPRNPDPECDPEYRESPWSGEEQPSGFKPFWASKCLESTAPQRMGNRRQLITRRSLVQVQPPQPQNRLISCKIRRFFFTFCPKRFPEKLCDFAEFAVDPNRDPDRS